MPSLLKDAWEWLRQAEEARKAVDQLTDPDAKEVMLQLGLFCERLARAAVARATAQEHEFALATRFNPPS